MSFDGLLNKTCTIQENTPTQDANTGQEIDSWANKTTGIACCVKTFSGTEIEGDNQVVHRATNKLYMRAQAYAINTAIHRIVLDGSNYDILHVSDASGRGHHLELWLEKVA